MIGALDGGMQDGFPLSLNHVLRRMRTVNGRSQVVTQVGSDGARIRATFAQVAARADRLAAGLRALGVGPGDRVGTLAWNSQEHLEAYYAIPCIGAVLHTLNLRLSPEQVAFTVNHAADSVIILDDSLVPMMERVLSHLDRVGHFIVIGDGDSGMLPNVVRYEQLLAATEPLRDWPEPAERSAAALCYTSGTTGLPKGILYSHRSLCLHALIMAGHDTFRLSQRDRVLAIVPMFHAMGWNLPYVAGLLGTDLIMPRSYLQSVHLARLIQEERVTSSAGVPTIWMDLLRYADRHDIDLGSLELAICGGTQVPEILMQEWEARYGVKVTQGWGMTEIYPGVTMAHDPPDAGDDERWARRAMAGRLSPFYEIRVVDDKGAVLPSDGLAAGEIEIRGPAVAAGYFRNDAATKDTMHDGWLRTGDIGTFDEVGWLRITDRAKDVIKSGGEWISSVDLESALIAHPSVREAAVIALPDQRWSERPLACVVTDRNVEASELQQFLSPKFAKWWLPDEYAFLDEIPKTSVGKLDKKTLRDMLAKGSLPRRTRA